MDASLTLPHRFGRYTLFDFIGRGGMAEIFLARVKTDAGASRLAVIKLILPEYADNKTFADQLVFEAKLAARLDHPNVVQVFDLGREAGRLYIAMDYIEGVDLSTLLRQCAKRGLALPGNFATTFVVEVLKGLDHAHRRTDDAGQALGVVHRDVSPSNVLVSLEGEVKLCDFGIAHANEAVDAQAMGEALVGKAGYMAPEHARGEQVDARADVFAAGVILWELLSGKRMYRKGEAASLLEVAKAGQLPPFEATHLPDFDRIRGIVAKALAPNREERYPSAAAFQKDLEGWARAHRLLGSPLRLGEWLTETFGTEYVERRRDRERRVRELEEESRMATLAQLEAEDRASRGTIPDVPSGPDTVIVNDEPEARPSAVETAPLTLPKTGLPAAAPALSAPPARSPWPMVAAALAVAAAVAAFLATR
jgi:serine/threonine protein kinase